MSDDAERKAKADADKAEADAARAAADAAKAAQEAEEWNSEAAKRLRAAELEQATAEAEKAVADAKRAQVSALVPDLAGVDRGETKTSGDAPLYGVVAAHRALTAVAQRIAEVISPVVAGKKVLITSQTDLASLDAAYSHVRSGLDYLIRSSGEILPQKDVETASLLPAAAVASAIPAALSLTSAKRTIQTFSSTIDSIAAVASIAASLPTTSVWLDDFRLVPESQVARDCVALQVLRPALDELVTAGQATEPKVRRAKDLITAIDSFLVAANAAPTDGARSPLISAALFEGMHAADALSHVLLVAGATSASQQVIDDKPLWFDDKFSVLSSVSVTYVLIETSTSKVVKSGVEVGTVHISGNIGKSFSIQAK